MPNNPQRIYSILANSQTTSTVTNSCYVDNVEHVTIQVRGLSGASPMVFQGSLDGPANQSVPNINLPLYNNPPNFIDIPFTNLATSVASTCAYADGLYTIETKGLHEIRCDFRFKHNTTPVTVVASGN